MRYLFIIMFFPFITNAQGWIGSSSDNSLYTYYRDYDVNVGIGTGPSPTAQLHTTKTVRFAGVGNNNSLNRVVVMDILGNLKYRDLSTITGGSWSLTGNSITGTDFIGTTNNDNFRVRTNNVQRMSVNTNGNVMINSQVLPTYVPNRKLTIHTDDNVAYLDSLNITAFTNVLDGIALVNTSASNADNHGVGITMISSGNGGDAAAIISGVHVGSNQMDIIFQTEDNTVIGSNPVAEAMRITHNKRVGIGTEAPLSRFHVNCGGTIGTGIRFENLSAGTGNILVVDANGNVFRSSSTAFTDPSVEQLKSEVEVLRQEIQELKTLLRGENTNSTNVKMSIYPNPASSTVNIRLSIADNFNRAQCVIVNSNGNEINSFNLDTSGSINKQLNCNGWKSGTYYCTLTIDGKSETQSFIIIK